jgi:hypothetical protein
VEALAVRFHRLFLGLERAHGRYIISGKEQGSNKLVGKATVLIAPVTDTLWKDHLEGKNSVGIVPIQDDSKCWFGAIDVDVYDDIDLPAIAKKVSELKFPLVCCRSKSGGLHAFCFLKEAIPAGELRSKLKEFSAGIGYGTAEIFPKQSEILAERGDIGSWINMPYFDVEKTLRYGFDKSGNKLSAEDFLKYAEASRVLPSELMASSIGLSVDFTDGPPCLQFLASHGFSPGTRNDGLFNLGVYLRKARPETWEIDLVNCNQKYMKPVLSDIEVKAVAKSLRRKTYNYACSKPPICGHCNLDVCRSRVHGIGAGAFSLQLAGLTKYAASPPVWFIDIENGGRLELNTNELQDQLKFQRRCIEALNKMPPMVDRVLWQTIIQGLLDKVTVIEAPVDASPRGQMLELLEKFLTSRAQARAREEMIIGKPWTSEGRHWFKMSDFLSYLDKSKFKDLKVHQVSSILKEIGGEHKFITIKGKGLNVWTVPEFPKQTEGFAVPSMVQKSPF